MLCGKPVGAAYRTETGVDRNYCFVAAAAAAAAVAVTVVSLHPYRGAIKKKFFFFFLLPDRPMKSKYTRRRSRDSLLVRAPESRSKGCEFEFRQERRDNFFLQS